jgi:hypothetical protein
MLSQCNCLLSATVAQKARAEPDKQEAGECFAALTVGVLAVFGQMRRYVNPQRSTLMVKARWCASGCGRRCDVVTARFNSPACAPVDHLNVS